MEKEIYQYTLSTDIGPVSSFGRRRPLRAILARFPTNVTGTESVSTETEFGNDVGSIYT